MANYFSIPDSALDPDAPVTSELAYALRDNPIAIAEGAAGAPRIRPGALNSTTSSLSGSIAAGQTIEFALGSYAFQPDIVIVGVSGTVKTATAGGSSTNPDNARVAIQNLDSTSRAYGISWRRLV